MNVVIKNKILQSKNEETKHAEEKKVTTKSKRETKEEKVDGSSEGSNENEHSADR